MTNPWLADRIHDVEQSIADIKRDVVPLQYLQIGWRPPDGGWSIAQVMEHLIITEESYLAEFARVLAEKPKAPNNDVWQPSLIGGFLIRSQMPDSKKKVTTPRGWRPPAEPRADVVDEYIKVRQRLIEAMRAADGYNLRRTKLSSPAAKFVRLNIGDAFMTLVVHTQRHLKQIERIRAQPGFPAG
jgi:hypothetical protein